MFARVIAVRAKSGRAGDLAKTIQEKILPILGEQLGFVDEILLVSDTERDQLLALSFWKTHQDAERFTHEHYERINGLISHLVDGAPISRTFDVDAFRSHHIAAGKAA